jgi:hypothetical protein
LHDGVWQSVNGVGSLKRTTVDECDMTREAMADDAYRSGLRAAYGLQQEPDV